MLYKNILISIFLFFLSPIKCMFFESKIDEELSERLVKYTKTHEVTDIIELIKQGANVNYSNREGKTPITESSWGDIKIVKLLVWCGANIEQTDRNGNTALKLAEYASSCINTTEVRIFLESYASKIPTIIRKLGKQRILNIYKLILENVIHIAGIAKIISEYEIDSDPFELYKLSNEAIDKLEREL